MAHDPQDWFDVAKAAKLSGLTVAMVNYLHRIGIVTPGCRCPTGRGRKRHYSFGDIVALRLTNQLLAAGASALRLKPAMRRLRKHHPQITLTSLPAKHVVISGADLYLLREGEPLERAMDGQLAFAFVIELSAIQREVQRMLKKAA